FEVNVRSATVLGFVGAGGIGFYLLTAMRLLNYSTSITCIIAILLMVGIIDYVGSFIRLKRI
ncbi:MAG: phosphonate ABC transporter, permease protein PhnE, partial [Flavobacteriales bacterium]|nr:phosphonate ABC transporter, permease protein PhnE [Flavobacteriales bacterium]